MVSIRESIDKRRQDWGTAKPPAAPPAKTEAKPPIASAPQGPTPDEERSRVSSLALRAALSYWQASDSTEWLLKLKSVSAGLSGPPRAYLAELLAWVEKNPGKDIFKVYTHWMAEGNALNAQITLEGVEDPVASWDFDLIFEKLDYIQSKIRSQSLGRALVHLGEMASKGEFNTQAEILAEMDALSTQVVADGIALGGCLPVQIFGNPDKEPVIEPVKAIIPGILFPGYTVAYGLWKKSKKTIFNLAASMAIHNGIPFLGRSTRKLRVMWIQRDMPVGLFLEYALHVREGLGLGPLEIPFISEPMDLMQPRHQALLLATLHVQKPEILFIDSSRAVSRIEEKESEQVAAFVRGFLIDQVRDKLGISVVLIAHPGKSKIDQSVRGSGDWEAAADSVIAFRPYVAKDATHPLYTEVFCSGRHGDSDFAFTVDHLVAEGGGWIIRELDADEREDLQDDPKPGRPTQIQKLHRIGPTVQGWHSATAFGKLCKIRKKDQIDTVLLGFSQGVLERDTTQATPLYRWKVPEVPEVPEVPGTELGRGGSRGSPTPHQRGSGTYSPEPVPNKRSPQKPETKEDPNKVF